MNVYELECGYTRHFVAAETEQEAYEKGTNPELYPDIHYLPFTIRLVEVPGYTITAVADEEPLLNGEEPKRRGRRGQ